MIELPHVESSPPTPAIMTTTKDGGDASCGGIVAQFDKNPREVIRVMLGSFKGRRTISIREWFRTLAGDLRPSKTGLDVDVSHLPTLAAAFESALATARAEGLIPSTH